MYIWGKIKDMAVFLGSVKDNKATAIGRFYQTAMNFERSYKRGGMQKLQKTIGSDLVYKKGNTWFYNNPKIIKMSISDLNKLTNKITK